MNPKLSALHRMITYHLNLNRSSTRPFRRKVAHHLLQDLDLKDCEMILLNTQYLTLHPTKTRSQDAQALFPLSDMEREYIKAVLILRLPSSFTVKKFYAEGIELTHQLTYQFTKF